MPRTGKNKFKVIPVTERQWAYVYAVNSAMPPSPLFLITSLPFF